MKKFFAIVSMLFAFSVTGLVAQATSAATKAPAGAPSVEKDFPRPPKGEPGKIGPEDHQAPAEKSGKPAIAYIAAALAVGIACIGGGLAVGKIGSAAMGAMAENAELSGKALPFVGLAEGICLWGFLVGLLIIVM